MNESELAGESGSQACPAAEVRLGVGAGTEVRFFVAPTFVSSHETPSNGPGATVDQQDQRLGGCAECRMRENKDK